MASLEHGLLQLARDQLTRAGATTTWRDALSTTRASLAAGLGDVRSAYIEVRLDDDPRSQTDILTHVCPRRRAAFAAALTALEDPRWRDLSRFCALWSAPDSVLAPISGVWLEYDDVFEASAPPSAHFCLVPDELRLHGQPAALSDAGWGRVRVGASLLGADERALDCFIAAAARSRIAGLVHVGVMTSRAPATVKGYFVVPRPELARFVSEAGWCGCVVELERLVEELSVEPLARERVYVDLTVDGAGRVEVAIVYPQQYVRSHGDLARVELVARFVGLGLCAAKHQRPLTHWPGRRQLATTTGRGQRVDRWLDLKLGLGPELQAKAYFGVDTRNLLLIGSD